MGAKEALEEPSVGSLEVKESSEDGEFHRKGTSLIRIQFELYLKLISLSLPLPLPRLIILSPSSAPVEVCPLLAVRDGAAEGWRRCPRAACGERVFPGGEAPPEAHRERQPDHLPERSRLPHWLLGLTGRWPP